MSQIIAETPAIDQDHVIQIAAELHISPDQVRATAELLADGATVPFIARYRKEITGSLDEVAITSIRDRLAQLAELRDRRLAIIKSLAEREVLTEELEAKIQSAKTLAELEDIYLPYRPKRRTRATIARRRASSRLPMCSWHRLPQTSRARRSRSWILREESIQSPMLLRELLISWLSA